MAKGQVLVLPGHSGISELLVMEDVHVEEEEQEKRSTFIEHPGISLDSLHPCSNIVEVFV